MTDPKLKYLWSRTWQNAHYDFKVEDRDGVVFGRICRVDYGPQQGRWEWHMNDDRYTTAGVTTAGFEADKKKAALAVEAAYEKAKGSCYANSSRCQINR